MGTYTIFRTLWRHWMSGTHPVYRIDSRHISPTPGAQIAWRIVRRVWRPIAAVCAVVVMLAAAEFLCGGTRRLQFSLSNTVFSLVAVVGGGFLLIALLLLAYLWPLAVAVNASTVIVGERERRTWDVLLTTPFDRADLLLAKLAASLRRFNPYGEMLLWVQAFLIAIMFVLVIGRLGSESDAGSGNVIVELPVLILAMAEFAIARFQDYVLSSLIGVYASLHMPHREGSEAIAFTGAAVLILIRALVTAAIMTGMATASLPIQAIRLATGPGSVVVLAWPAVAAVPILIAMIVVREAAIRTLFRWLVAHLADTTEARMM